MLYLKLKNDLISYFNNKYQILKHVTYYSNRIVLPFTINQLISNEFFYPTPPSIN